MPKPSSKRPDEPEVEELLERYTPEVQAIARRLRQSVFQAAPEAIEQVDLPAKMLAYGFARTYTDMICVIMPLKAAVNFGFPRGAEMNDPAGLLQGTGKRARHVQVASLKEAGSPALLRLLKQAVKMAGSGARS
jgi:hypothetical protein